MRCSIGSVKKLIESAQGGSPYLLMHDRVWVPLTRESAKEDLAVLLYPADIFLKDKREEKEKAERRIAAGDKRSVTHEKVARIDALFRNIGKVGVITDYINFQDIIVKFEDGTRGNYVGYILWVPLASDSPDWRPDETLPEDYYSL